jgi:hypothetical protein
LSDSPDGPRYPTGGASAHQPNVPLSTSKPRLSHIWLNPLGLSVLLLVSVGLKYGISLHPNWFRFVDAANQWPDASNSLLAVGDRALLSNVATSWLAGAIGATTEHSFIIFSAALTALALILPLLLAPADVARSFTRLYLLVAAGGSLAHVLLMWVGGYDALLVCALVVGALSRNNWISASGWFVASFAHTSVALPALVLWATFKLLDKPREVNKIPIQSIILSSAGVALGDLTIKLTTNVWGGSTDRLTLFKAIPFQAVLESYAQAWILILLSGLGITWALLLWKSIRVLRSTKIFFLLAFSTILITPLIAVDQTRISALILCPLILSWIASVSCQIDPEKFNTVWRWMVVPALLLPIPVVWMGTAHW